MKEITTSLLAASAVLAIAAAGANALPAPTTPNPGLKYYYPVKKSANPAEREFDVVVYGGTPAGVGAAVQAKRMGKTAALYVFRRHVGGLTSAGLTETDIGKKSAIGGMAIELYKKIGKMTGFRPSEAERAFLELLDEAGVPVFFEHRLDKVEKKGGKIERIVFENGDSAKGKMFVDATGDGDLAYMAGARFISGQDETGIMQPSTLMFSVSGYDLGKFLDYAEKHPEDFGIKEEYAHGYDPDFFRSTPGHCFIGLTEMIKKARENGDFEVPRNQFIYITTPDKDRLSINTTRILNIDASEADQLSDGLIEGYRQIHVLLRFMNKYVPGFENARLVEIAPTLGIRETRHFKGVHTLTRDEMYSDYVKENAIAQSAYNIDIHSGTQIHIDLTPVSKPFGIPYLCLVPETLNGVLLSGRTISVDTATYASARVMGPCIAVGEAAGEAAAIAIEEGKEVRDLDVQEIRKRLRENGNLF